MAHYTLYLINGLTDRIIIPKSTICNTCTHTRAHREILLIKMEILKIRIIKNVQLDGIYECIYYS
jgi:hypothetical protein